MKPEVRFVGYGYSNVGNRALYITIDGRQALHEGPRRRGRCNLCKGLCRGTNPLCDRRVFDDADQIRRNVPR